jgi:hypothetical protein
MQLGVNGDALAKRQQRCTRLAMAAKGATSPSPAGPCKGCIAPACDLWDNDNPPPLSSPRTFHRHDIGPVDCCRSWRTAAVGLIVYP